jgi:hypothetical protein
VRARHLTPPSAESVARQPATTSELQEHHRDEVGRGHPFWVVQIPRSLQRCLGTCPHRGAGILRNEIVAQPSDNGASVVWVQTVQGRGRCGAESPPRGTPREPSRGPPRAVPERLPQRLPGTDRTVGLRCCATSCEPVCAPASRQRIWRSVSSAIAARLPHPAEVHSARLHRVAVPTATHCQRQERRAWPPARRHVRMPVRSRRPSCR